MKELIIKIERPDRLQDKPLKPKTFKIHEWQHQALKELSREGINCSRLVRQGITYILESIAKNKL